MRICPCDRKVPWVRGHTDYTPLKYLCRINSETLPEDTPSDLDFEYIDISAVDGLGRIGCLERLTFGEAPSRARRVLRRGDVLIATVRTYLRAIARVDTCEEKVVCSTGFAVLRPGEKVDSRFLYYWTRSEPFVAAIVSRSSGISYPAINPAELGCLPFPVMALEEQRAIASLLKREMDRIDQLVAQKQRLIKVLEEKRAALISRAVTEGINPAAALRDSGVGCLGHVPAHWAVKRLKYAISSITQGWSPQCHTREAEPDEWGILKVGCVNGWNFDETENKALPAELEPDTALEVKPGDVLISRANTRELLGSAVIVPLDVRNRLLLCDKLYRIRTAPVLDPSLLALMLRVPSARAQIEPEATGTSRSMQNIGQDTIKNLFIAIPPIEEQHLLLHWITVHTGSIDAMLRPLTETITRLREYRSALITGAVTGQLDIRKHEKVMEALA